MLSVCYSDLMHRYYDNNSLYKDVHYCCIVCGEETNNIRLNRCPTCQGAIDAIYNMANVNINNSYNPLERYFSLLPIINKTSLTWLGEGNTACIHANKLGIEVGLKNLYLKNEAANPTRSTKDRIASVGLSRFKELNINHFVVASTGNSSMAYARAIQMVEDAKVDIFVAKNFLHRLNYIDHPRIRTYVGDSDFVAADILAKQHAAKEGLFFDGGFFSVSRREGLKIAYLEAFDQMPDEPDFIFQAVSSGMGLLGAYKGALEYKMLGRLKKLPAFFAVQQESCSPMAHAFKEGQIKTLPHHIVNNPDGLAEAILRGDPTQSYPYIHFICQSSNGQVISVNDDEILKTHQQLIELEGLHACYASAVALAGAIKMRQLELINAEASVLVNITGANRPFSPIPKNIYFIK